MAEAATCLRAWDIRSEEPARHRPDDVIVADACPVLIDMQGESRLEPKRVEDSDQVVGVAHRPRVGVFGEERSGPYGGAPQARDIGAMLVVEGPAIYSLQAPGLEMFETDESSSTRREVIIAGALPDGPLLQVWVPHRGDHARYRVRLLQVAEDFTLGDLSVYGSVISR